MIAWALQIGDQNLLQFHYSSGADRYCGLDDSGSYVMTKTQRKFMENADRYIVDTHEPFHNRRFYYWLDKNNPDETVMRYMKQPGTSYKKEVGK